MVYKPNKYVILLILRISNSFPVRKSLQMDKSHHYFIELTLRNSDCDTLLAACLEIFEVAKFVQQAIKSKTGGLEGVDTALGSLRHLYFQRAIGEFDGINFEVEVFQGVSRY